MLSVETIEEAEEGTLLHSLCRKTEWFLGERTEEKNRHINRQKAETAIYKYLKNISRFIYVPNCIVDSKESLEMQFLNFLIQSKYNASSSESVALDKIANEIIDGELYSTQ